MKRVFSIVIAVLLGSLTAFAEKINVADLAIVPGSSTTIEIELDNLITNLVAFQMDLTLPEGIGIDNTGCTLSSRITDVDQVLTVGRLSENTYRLTSTSLSLTPVSGTGGTLLALKLTSTSNFVNGQAIFSNILFSTATSQEVTVADALFTINTLYTFSYKVDGKEYKTSSIAYGTELTAEVAPTREGYTFSGWSEIPATMPAHDVVVTGSFAVNSYTLTYQVDGKEYKTASVAYGTELTAETAPKREGYTFSGWSEIPATMPAHDVVITGNFSVNSYTLTYKVDGEVYKTATVVYGTALTVETEPTKEGYAFSGWSEIPAAMPAHDVVVTGSFSRGQYSLTYVVDGLTYKVIRMDYENPIVPEGEPTREGYTFSGWSEIPATMPAHDVVVTGSFAVNSYTLTYKVDGEVYKMATIVYGTELVAEAAPIRDGYTFSGWSEIPATMPAHDVVVTGSFTVNSYTLTYMVDGKEYKSVTIAYGIELTAETAPKKEGYTFSGWSEIPATMPAHDVLVTGSFTVNSYTLTYQIDGKEYKTASVGYGTELTAENEPTKEGYTFSGWSEIPATMPAHDVVVTGSFTVNSYTLTYQVDGKEYKTASVAYGTELTAENEPTKEGYTFSGWSEIPATMPAHDVVVTGSFAVNSYTLTYQVDGKEYKTASVAYGTELTAEVAPTKEGYTFSGWSEIPKTMPAHDVVVTGSFSKGQYSLTYIVDGQTYKVIRMDYDNQIILETEPMREGYTFSGWSEIPATMPAHDVVITGSFTVNSYTLTYKVDGEVYKMATIAYGTELAAEAAPIKEGYTFSGWSEIPKTMPAHDVVVTGHFSKEQYSLTYVIDGQTYKVIRMDYDNLIVPENEPVREGYTFSGWSEPPATMPAHDVVITGSFTVNSYTLTYKVDGEVYKMATIAYGTELAAEAAPIKEGYTFSGWSEMPETMPAHDVVVTGSFSKGQYSLTYIVDGQTYKVIRMDYDNLIVPEDEPTREGYTFSGWSEIPETMPAHDVVVMGDFAINSYTLSYKVDDEVYKFATIVYGTKLTAEAAPSRVGYTFSGWSEIPATMPARDVVVTGSFTVNSYTLTYKVDGEVYKTASVAYGTELTAEAAPIRDGYTFSGWSEIPATMPAHDVVVTGSFTVNSYTLTYKVDGDVYKTVTIAYGTELAAEAAPIKEGYMFSGWSEIPSTMPAHDVVVSGTFSKGQYSLTYLVDGQTYKVIRMDYENPIVPEGEPTREGYTFSGWSEIPTTMPAQNLVITGSFSINTYVLTYKVDGKEYKTTSVVYGTELTAETAPTKEGYTFSGWSEIPTTMPAHDVVVTGSFTVNSYTLTYQVDGKEYKNTTVAYGTEIIAEAAPIKEGYMFSGWSEIPSTMPAHDVVVTGSFSVNSYTLTYQIDGKEYKTASVAYGTELTAENEPTKEGYTFSGWSEIPATMPAHDVVVTGSFTVNSYTLTYMVDGKKYKTASVAYGTELTAENEPTKEGYTFSGWSEIPATMPAHDVVVTGTFSVNRYTVTFKYGDEVVTTESVEYGSEIPLPESLGSERYTLVEWLEVPDTMPAHDITIYADFVDSIKAIQGNTQDAEYYRLNGVKRKSLQRGINIVRMSDGTTRKVMVR